MSRYVTLDNPLKVGSLINPYNLSLDRLQGQTPLIIYLSENKMLTVKIHVKGALDRTWSEWFENINIQHINNEESVLYGSVADQSALYSLINRLSRLGLALISIETELDENLGEYPDK